MACIVCMFCAATAIASPAQTLITLHSFNGPDGLNPYSSLVLDTEGNLYGTTSIGGSGCQSQGCGTVFKITPSGNLNTLHSFDKGDGYWPFAGLVQGTDGNFYGTTSQGGDLNNCDHSGCGTVFKISPSGSLTTLHVFEGSPSDGSSPIAGLTQANDGNLYGTTASGGFSGQGTVFKITSQGALTTLYSFCPAGFPCADGADPFAGLVQATDGNLYGTTEFGGASGDGTVFKITLAGTLTTIHNFNGADGAYPLSGLIQASDGNLYGTTSGGGEGANCTFTNSCGTVFRVTPGGTLTKLYSFCSQPNCTDGAAPQYGSLLQGDDGSLYGTTWAGGANDEGTIFRITTGGALTTVHTFNNYDGNTPEGGLAQDSEGNLYGTTFSGGAYFNGTVFELQVPPTLTVSTSGDGTVASTDGFISCPGTCSHTYPAGTPVTLNAAPGQGWVFGGWNGACVGTSSCTVTMTQSLSVDAIFSQALQFLTVTPCRLVDTRPDRGGSGPIQGGTFQSFPVPQEGGCNIPTSAAAYSLNVSVVPQGPLGYLTIWPTGEGQPVVSTMNSVDGRVKADAAIVPAGSNGEVSVYVTNTSDVILDIDGYFAPVSSSTLAFYPLPPCRVVDTRVDTFPPGLGPPQLSALTPRDLPVLLSPCIPSGVNPAAYSFNFTV